MLIYEDGEKIEEYDKFIKVDRPLTPKITELTGITDEMLENEGVVEEIIAQDLKERLTPGTLMVAHNAQFDLCFIYYLLRRHFPLEVDYIVANLDWIDTVTVFKDYKEYPHRLCDVVGDCPEINFHRAIDDTKALVIATQKLKSVDVPLDKYVNLFGYNPKYGISGKEFKFIKYRRQPYRNFKLGIKLYDYED